MLPFVNIIILHNKDHIFLYNISILWLELSGVLFVVVFPKRFSSMVLLMVVNLRCVNKSIFFFTFIHHLNAFLLAVRETFFLLVLCPKHYVHNRITVLSYILVGQPALNA